MVRSGLRNRSIMDLNQAAFKYDFTIVYKELRCVDIGSLSVVCPHCKAMKFKSEMLRWWQGYTARFNSSARAIVFVSIWKYYRIKIFFCEYTII